MIKNILRVFFVLIFIFNFSFAEDKKNEVSNSELRVIVELIKLNQEVMNKRFEEMQKYSDKRFEDMQRHMDKRFEAVDKRFETVDKRFEDMRNYMDKRFEAVDKRFDTIFVFLSFITAILLAGIAYLIKDRRVIEVIAKDLKVEVEKIDNSLESKADKKRLEEVIEVIEQLARNDIEVQEMLKKHHLSYQG